MVETRTLCLYDYARRCMSVFRYVASCGGVWTARTASYSRRTRSRSYNNPESPYFPISYLRWTGRTAISGFSVMREHALVITLELAISTSSSSRHIKPGNCCPYCPSFDFIEEYRPVSVLLHVRLFLISVLPVQNSLRSIAFLVNVAFPTGLEGRNWRGWSQILSIRLTVSVACRKPTPWV